MAIKKGDKVKVEYEGKLDSGKVFDSSKHDDHSHPLEFEVGSGKVIKGFDDAVVGMDKGEEKEFSIKPEEAYGERKEQLRQEVPRTAFPEGQEPKEGMMLMLKSPQGQQFPAKIMAVSDDKITLDLNHPLAGENLNFKIKVLEVN